jgi:hypothetical protein
MPSVSWGAVLAPPNERCHRHVTSPHQVHPDFPSADLGGRTRQVRPRGSASTKSGIPGRGIQWARRHHSTNGGVCVTGSAVFGRPEYDSQTDPLRGSLESESLHADQAPDCVTAANQAFKAVTHPQHQSGQNDRRHDTITTRKRSPASFSSSRMLIAEPVTDYRGRAVWQASKDRSHRGRQQRRGIGTAMAPSAFDDLLFGEEGPCCPKR